MSSPEMSYLCYTSIVSLIIICKNYQNYYMLLWINFATINEDEDSLISLVFGIVYSRCNDYHPRLEQTLQKYSKLTKGTFNHRSSDGKETTF